MAQLLLFHLPIHRRTAPLQHQSRSLAVAGPLLQCRSESFASAQEWFRRLIGRQAIFFFPFLPRRKTVVPGDPMIQPISAMKTAVLLLGLVAIASPATDLAPTGTLRATFLGNNPVQG